MFQKEIRRKTVRDRGIKKQSLGATDKQRQRLRNRVTEAVQPKAIHTDRQIYRVTESLGNRQTDRRNRDWETERKIQRDIERQQKGRQTEKTDSEQQKDRKKDSQTDIGKQRWRHTTERQR